MNLTTKAADSLPESARSRTDALTVWFERQSHIPGVPPSPDDAQRVPQMRRLVEARLRSCGLEGLIDPMLLVTSELVTNALRHGTGTGVSLLLSCNATTARLTVSDGSAQHRTPRLAPPDAESGRGLHIVSLIACEYEGSWGVSSDLTQTWCTLTTPAPTPAPTPSRGAGAP
ncbi:ATP-binding protein [Streptomyces sp. NPDC051639]|uniref:ATP-binding protein n=1 Tax=Streptomyces sp. NPDC051639 TaxID=3155671 RepID=UPI00341E5954